MSNTPYIEVIDETGASEIWVQGEQGWEAYEEENTDN